MQHIFKYLIPKSLIQYYHLIKNINKLGYDKSFKKGITIDNNNLPIPWFTYSALQYLNQLDLQEKTIFEWGSGYSSLYFARKSIQVISIEDNKEWYDKIIKKVSPPNRLLLAKKENYVNLIKEQNKKFDVIIIDGSLRPDCIKIAPDFLNDSGIIIVDNSDWFKTHLKSLRDRKFIQIDFRGFGPINSYIWTTSIFFTKGFNFSYLNKFPE